MTLFKHIFLRLLLVLVPLLMAMAPAMAQDTVYVGQSKDLSVIAIDGDTYVWELYKDVSAINFAIDPGNCLPGDADFTGSSTGPTVNVLWKKSGTYFFKVTATRPGCTNNLKVGKMIVLEELPTAVIDPPDSICMGAATSLTIRLTGAPPWSITYTTNGANPQTITGIAASPYLLPVSPSVTTSYTITSVNDAHLIPNDTPSNTVTVFVKPKPLTSPIWHN